MNTNKYLLVVSKMINLLSAGTLKQTEVDRIICSENWWVDHKPLSFQNRKIRKGEVYQFDFGKNLEPEMSYEHRGLVIGGKRQLLYVLPVFSYVQGKHIDIYSAAENPTGDLYLLDPISFSFVKHPSVLKLNDIRTVSTKRIMYKHKEGKIDPNTEVFKEIEFLTFAKYFPELHHELESLRKEKITASSHFA